MATQDAAAKAGPDVRAKPPAPRLTKPEAAAYTAANLYALMAWLYDKPRM